MAAFSPAVFEATIDELNRGMADLSGHLQRVGPTANAAVSNFAMPGFVADGLISSANKLIEIGSAVLAKIEELLVGAIAPITFFSLATDWRTSVGGQASGVAGSIGPNALRARLVWTGEAATSYTGAVAGQGPAATSIETLSSTIANSLTTCAAAGLAFYLALAAILVKFIVAAIAAIIALGTAVFSWVGLGIIVEECGVNTAMILTAVGLLVTLLGVEGGTFVAITGGTGSDTAFPGGHWPKGTMGAA